MDCPGVLTPVEKREVQCGKYQLSFYDGEAPVMIQARDGPWKGGLWNATGEEARIILGYIERPGAVERYIDMVLEGKKEEWNRWSVDMHDL